MIVLRVIASCVQEFLELSIGHWRTVHVKRRDMNAVTMRAPGGVFPRILHVDSWIVSALDLDAAHLKVVVTLGNADHPWRWSSRRLGRRDFDYRLRNRLPFARIA